jgi:hypothetical protein
LRSGKVCATTSTCAGCGEVKPGGAPPSQVAQETFVSFGVAFGRRWRNCDLVINGWFGHQTAFR